VSHPLTWGIDVPAVWFLPAGIGFLLATWLGPRAAWGVAIDGLLVLVQTRLVGTEVCGRTGVAAWVVGAGNALVGGAEVWVAWWCYHRAARGSWRLLDPRSASLFLILGPGLVSGLFALLLSLLAPLTTLGALWHRVLAFWLSHALGWLAVVPLGLTLATPWLVRRGYTGAEPRTGERSRGVPARLTLGDRLEIAGLTLGTTIVGLLLVATHCQRGVIGWQLWVLPLLLVVWASLRQGSRGGTIVASVSTLLALVFLAMTEDPGEAIFALQGNFLAQCSTALLVGVSFSWIQTSEACYRQVVSCTPVVLYSARLHDLSSPLQRPQALEVTFISPACQSVFGCPPEDLLADYTVWLEYVHAEDRELVLAALSQLSLQRQPVTYEYRLHPVTDATEPPGVSMGRTSSRGPNPRPRAEWVRETLVPVIGEDGYLVGWDGMVVDITEQRQLADDLRRTTGMLQALVANLPAGVFFVHVPSGRPILVNARARQLLGQHEDRAAGLSHWSQVYRLYKPDGSLYPVDELPISIALRRGATSMRDDIVVRRPDGRHVPLVTWAAPVDLEGNGHPDAAVWVLEDLTALHQAEAAHRASEARLRAAIDAMAEGVLTIDGSGHVTACNPAACDIFGLDREQMIGRSITVPNWRYVREDGTPSPPEEHPALISLRSGEPVLGTILGVELQDDAAVRWLLVNAMPLSEGRDNGAARVVATFTDVTALRPGKAGMACRLVAS
jgi:PAS domain S-box-containing protein